MLLPDLLVKLVRSSFVLKLFAAIYTSVVLNISSLSVLLYSRTFAKYTVFLDMIVDFSCYVMQANTEWLFQTA